MSNNPGLWGSLTTQKVKKHDCQLCESTLKPISNGVKCSSCDRYLHKKCLARACMLFDVSETWQCRDCANLCPDKFELSFLKKENECLKQQVHALTALVSEFDFVNCVQREKIQQYLGHGVSCCLIFVNFGMLSRLFHRQKLQRCDILVKPTATLLKLRKKQVTVTFNVFLIIY